MARSKSEITELLDAWSDGDPEALDRLMSQVVDELRGIARRFMAIEAPDHTLQPTALVNEVYLRLAGRRSVQWENRAQFFRFMADLMRRILVDHARRRKSAKRGSDAIMLSLDQMSGLPQQGDTDLVALDDALKDLAVIDPRQSRIIELRYFAGLSVEATAEALGIGTTTVKREWRTARLWLRRQIRRE